MGAWIEISLQSSLQPHLLQSLLSWERGLKSQILSVFPALRKSLLSWERGLKLTGFYNILFSKTVAPLVGAWIEIDDHLTGTATVSVAPLVGAWIEIMVRQRL